MFIDFFYILRKRGVPVSITEWMTLTEALSRGLISNLDEFYYLARAMLVKTEAHFDHYDVAFQEYFKGIETPEEITQQVMDWLSDSRNWKRLEEQDPSLVDKLSLPDLLEELEKRLKEQKEQHDGGDYWIGRWGTSPFGHSGNHPGGIRIGGQPGGRMAVKIAQERRFQNLRSDLTLDTRQIKMALRRLRHLRRTGPEDELDIEETIDETAKNYGELELIWRRQRKNTVKLLLLMDVGGSMEPYALMCSQLFSAAHSSSHFKKFEYFYFHNCVYQNLFRDIERREAISTEHILRTLEPDYKVILVGDARMDPMELMERFGAIYYYEQNDAPGIAWLTRISKHFTHAVWLNPDNMSYWEHPTVQTIGKLFPMFPLTLDGLERGVKRLVVKR